MTREGDGMTVIERTPGHNLYREWIDAPGTDAAEKEWYPQNPAVKERWEKLAARVAADRGAVDLLREIAESDPVDNALDPGRNVRIAASYFAPSTTTGGQ